jgi:membrane protein implicated in regulation of membrane protease activity
MSFFELITAPQVWPFSVSLLLFFALALTEIALVWVGLGADVGLSVEIDLPPDAGQGGWLLDWLGIGRIPYLVTLAGLLLCFGIVGLILQDLLLEFTGKTLFWPLAAVVSLLISLPCVRGFNRLLGRVWPREIETSAVSTESLVGHEAVVVLGTVTPRETGQIKVRDSFGTTHYGLALADTEASFAVGERLLIVGRRGPHFLVIQHPNPSIAA